MSSSVDIANFALTLLGESRITSLDAPVKQARELKAIYDITRDALLGGYNWNFAMARAALPALSDAPLFEYGAQYQLPNDPYCLRVVMIGEYYVGVDLTDYRNAPTEEYAIEGRRILTDMSAPLNIKYVRQVTDTTQFDACFTKMFGAKLAADACEAITQSETKRARAEDTFTRELRIAVRSNAIQLPPKKLADDEWIDSRL